MQYGKYGTLPLMNPGRPPLYGNLFRKGREENYAWFLSTQAHRSPIYTEPLREWLVGQKALTVNRA